MMHTGLGSKPDSSFCQNKSRYDSPNFWRRSNLWKCCSLYFQEILGKTVNVHSMYRHFFSVDVFTNILKNRKIQYIDIFMIIYINCLIYI